MQCRCCSSLSGSSSANHNALSSNLADAIPKVLDAIEAAGLDNLGPYQEPEFPVPEEDRMTFIDRTVLAD